MSVLSGRANEALQLIHSNQVKLSSDPPPLDQEQVLHEYHDVFPGLEKLPGTYHIDMDQNAKAVQENPDVYQFHMSLIVRSITVRP